MLTKSRIKTIRSEISKIKSQLTNLESLLDDTQSEDEAQALARAEKGLCTFCGEKILPDEVQFRGAHQRCYKRVNRAIGSGQITEDQAISRGWILVRAVTGRPIDKKDPIAVLEAERTKKRKKAKS